MKEISPSQFIEAILESQRARPTSLMELKVRTFNSMVDKLFECGICVQFGFSDLIEFASNFEEPVSYNNFALQIPCTEDFFCKMKSYNRIYTSVENFTEINNVWASLMK